MEGTSRVSVTIVDRNYPPNKSVIAESASDLAKFLIDNNVDVNVVHTDGEYQGGGATGKVVGNTHSVKSVYNGKNKILRLFGSLIEGRRLIKKASEITKGTVIVMTSPPLLNFWAAKVFKKKNIPWIFWSMDLYPEAFVASKLSSENNPVYKYFHNTTYGHPPKALIALGDLQANYLEEKFQKKLPKVILPCGVFLSSSANKKDQTNLPSWKKEIDKVYLGYIGNLGEAHSVDFIKNIMDNIKPEAHKLILVVYGSKAYHIKDYYDPEKHKNVEFLDFLPRHELKFIDLHLVSLLPDWVNLCVPSKLVSAVHNGSIFLFYGTEYCDSWQYLQKAGWIINKGQNDLKEIKEFLTRLDKKVIQNKKSTLNGLPESMYQNTKLAYSNIIDLIKQGHS